MTALALNSPARLAVPDGLNDHRTYARLGFAAIALVFGGFGIWATFAPLDRAAVAQGQVAVETNNKPVQHLEGGIIREILVRDAQQLQEGECSWRRQQSSALPPSTFPQDRCNLVSSHSAHWPDVHDLNRMIPEFADAGDFQRLSPPLREIQPR
jgi:hypothetical protein